MAPKEKAVNRRRKAPPVQDAKTPTKKAKTEKPAENATKKTKKAESPAPKQQRGEKIVTQPKKTRGEKVNNSEVTKAASVPVVKKTQRKIAVPVRSASVDSDSRPVHRIKRTRKTVEGVVLTCGQGDVGQLGLGVDAMEKMRFTLVPGLEKVVDICAGGMHTMCLTSDGTVYTFGCDDEGALGRQATDDACFTPDKVNLEGPAVQISAGDSHSAALLEDGRVFAWGSFRDSHGTMGLKRPNETSKLPTLIKLDKAVEKIASGSDHLVLVTDSGQLYSCGCPEQGQLGRIPARSASRDSRGGMSSFLTPQPIHVRKNLVFTDVWASNFGTYANEKAKGIFRCGLNNYHQLGLESEGPIFQPKSENGGLNQNHRWIKLEGGDHHTLLLSSTGKVYCLGRKEYGRLGLGENSEDAHEVTAIPALENVKCVDIACGSAVSFAVTENGEVYGWGMGNNYQLSAGDDEADVWEPRLIKAKQLVEKKVVLAAAGGQHSVLLVT